MDETSSPLRHRSMPLDLLGNNNNESPSTRTPSRVHHRLKGHPRRISTSTFLLGKVQWTTLFVTIVGLFTFQARVFKCVQNNLDATARGAPQPASLLSRLSRPASKGLFRGKRPTQLMGRKDRRQQKSATKSSTSRRNAVKSTGEITTSQIVGPKPTLYLDIGPYKTGSSFLQCALSRNGYDLLKQDNVLYLGTCANECVESVEQYEFCLLHSGGSVFHKENSSRIELDGRLANKLAELARDGRDALMVWEYFSDRTETLLESFMSVAQGFEVRIIVHYRRLYDWLPSMYDQLHRPKWNGHEQYMIWPGDLWTKPSGKKVKGRIRVPFDMYEVSDQVSLGLDPGYRGTISKIKKTGLHPTRRAWERWIQYDPNITVIDMHHLPAQDETNQGDPLLTHLFCRVIPTLPHMCAAVQRNEVEILEAGRNTRYHADNYEMLAVEAHRRGLHPLGIARLSRSEAVNLVQYQQERVFNKTNNDFPLSCMSNHSLDMLHNLSLLAEMELIPGFEEDHRQGFDRAVQKGKFCFIDVHSTLEQKPWQDFFRPFISVAPIVLERSKKGEWAPDFEDSTKSIQDLFFALQLGRPRKPLLPQLEFLGFLNVPGTGMNALVNHVQNAQPDQQYRNYWDFEVYHSQSQGGETTLSALSCIFGSRRASSNVSRSEVPLKPCMPIGYSALVQEWLLSLPYLNASGVFPPNLATVPPLLDNVVMTRQAMDNITTNHTLAPTRNPETVDDKNVNHDDDTGDDAEGDDGGDDEEGDDSESYYDDGLAETSSKVVKNVEAIQVSLTAVIMVRDPFQRMIRLFPEWQHANQATLTGQSTLAPKDFESWLEWLGHNATRRESGITRDQFRSLADDVTKAVSMISGMAQTMVLLHECWDVSFQLLRERYPNVMDETTIQDFSPVNGSRYESMRTASPNFHQARTLDLQTLRTKAQGWLEDDYDFYHAAVTQFRKMLNVSTSLKSADVQDCLEKLTSPAISAKVE